MVLPFQEQIISDLLSDPSGGLVVLSSGLSLSKLLSSLLLLRPASSSPSRPLLLLLLSSSPSLSLSLRNSIPNSQPKSEPNSEPKSAVEISDGPTCKHKFKPNSEPNSGPGETTTAETNPKHKFNHKSGPSSEPNSEPNFLAEKIAEPNSKHGYERSSGPSSEPSFLAEIIAENNSKLESDRNSEPNDLAEIIAESDSEQECNRNIGPNFVPEPSSKPNLVFEPNTKSKSNSEPSSKPSFLSGATAKPNSKSKSKRISKQNSEPSSDSSFLAEITAEVPLARRLALYATGSALFVTSRILIVDLLSGRLHPSDVAGVAVLNAHAVSESSTEAFIVRILRTGNPGLFVWAFSERPQAMVAGFAKTERIMRCLYLRKLHLWPRFQVYVSQDLERDPPEVVDVRVPISPHMKVIQKAVIEVMDACLKEMRKTNKVDVDDLTVENGLFKSFDEIVRRQLDPIWHTLGKKTKQLVSDLKTLRKLLDYLVRYDAVTYLKYLDSLRAAESFRSVWIFAESSYKIFEYAKKRVYQFKKLDGDELMGKTKALPPTKKRKVKGDHKKEDSLPTTSTSEVVLEEVLEEPPKWKVLREVLQEIEDERQKQALLSAEQMVDYTEDNGIVLVVCKDEYSCMQLEDCITKGPQKVMREEWEKYLLSKVELRNAPKHNKKKAKGPKGFGVLDGVVPVVHGQKEEAGASNQEQKALLAAAARITKQTEKDIVEDDAQPSVGKGKGKRKNGRPTSRDDKSGNEVLVNVDTEMLLSGARRTKNGTFLNRSVLRKHSVRVDATSKDTKLLPPVCFYALESEQNILDTLKPSTVVVYHPDMAFVREIEIYKAENPSKQLKVYFLFYEESTEVQKFESSIRRENGAFESLIRQKSLMMIPVDQDGRCLGPNSSIDPQPSTLQNSVTRKAGGRKETEKETRIIVDMREFMSSLPNVLHQKGMRILPVTLEVGDYILSPLICVERKSIQDLFGSFASGRLFNQVEMMSRYYRIPVLLIEFSQDKSFSFLSASDIGDDVTPTSIISKLSLLVLHFPRLRIVWSRSLHATAEIFASLKANQDEPDEVKAIRVGVPSEEGIVENDVRAENYNTSAVEFLRRLPGVTDSNYRSIMDNCESLSDLALLPLEKLAELMGGQKSAKTLRDFLDAKYPTLL